MNRLLAENISSFKVTVDVIPMKDTPITNLTFDVLSLYQSHPNERDNSQKPCCESLSSVSHF